MLYSSPVWWSISSSSYPSYVIICWMLGKFIHSSQNFVFSICRFSVYTDHKNPCFSVVWTYKIHTISCAIVLRIITDSTWQAQMHRYSSCLRGTQNNSNYCIITSSQSLACKSTRYSERTHKHTALHLSLSCVEQYDFRRNWKNSWFPHRNLQQTPM